MVGLQSTLSNLRLPAEDITRGVLTAIDNFVVGNAVCDDITMVACRHLEDGSASTPPGPTDGLRFSG